MGNTKNILLVTGFLVLVIIAYQYSFSKTIDLNEKLEILQKQVQQSTSLKKRSSLLQEKEKDLDFIILKNRAGNSSLQNNLLKVLNEFSEKYSCKIISFKEPHIDSSSENSKVTSFRFILEGEYKDLEQVLYTLETEHSFGSLSHVNFETSKDYRRNKTFLRCTAIIQNVQ